MILMAPLTTPSTFARAAWIITFTLANVLVACTPEWRIRLNPFGHRVLYLCGEHNYVVRITQVAILS